MATRRARGRVDEQPVRERLDAHVRDAGRASPRAGSRVPRPRTGPAWPGCRAPRRRPRRTAAAARRDDVDVPVGHGVEATGADRPRTHVDASPRRLTRGRSRRCTAGSPYRPAPSPAEPAGQRGSGLRAERSTTTRAPGASQPGRQRGEHVAERASPSGVRRVERTPGRTAAASPARRSDRCTGACTTRTPRARAPPRCAARPGRRARSLSTRTTAAGAAAAPPRGRGRRTRRRGRAPARRRATPRASSARNSASRTRSGSAGSPARRASAIRRPPATPPMIRVTRYPRRRSAALEVGVLPSSSELGDAPPRRAGCAGQRRGPASTSADAPRPGLAR